MTQEFDLAARLRAGLPDRAAAWELVKDYARHWVSPLADDDGCGQEELDAAESRLGVRLPGALREAQMLLGRRDDLIRNHNRLLTPAQLFIDTDGEALVFHEENQGVALWGVLLADLDQIDPAVFVRVDLADKESEKWEPWLDRLSLSMVEIVLSESLQLPDGLSDFMDEVEDGHLEALEADFTRLPFPLIEDSRWYVGEDVLVREDGRAVLHARARSSQALDRLRDRLPGYWIEDDREELDD
ncbi:SMI1/KNR4 family protein [Streptomyces albipurpureus]|uniref:SMI1/KNR4 family protein n=1 Tax=Streptomyces albipurpureus TaxID=2897419 RepID=A0ABT0UH81_9ACTN|nr:SMI1/KNR4 family protein [Streptomyces sp. CWNU-1]MCM2387994.1 SMI1/KNR4 family protein [Streptomyces sp. CWNU-1]